MATLDTPVFVLRVAALYTWLQAALLVCYLPDTIDSDAEGEYSSWSTITVALQALFGAALWFGSRPLARVLFGGSAAKEMTRAAAIAGLGFILAGLYVITLAVQETADLMYWHWYESVMGNPSEVRASSVSIAALTILGVALVAGGRRLAARMFRSDGPAQPLAWEIQPVAFSIVGIWLAAPLLAELLAYAMYSWWNDDGYFATETESASWQWTVYYLKLAMGVALFLGGGILSRAWRWTRTAGLDRPAP